MAFHAIVADAKKYGFINENTLRLFKVAYPLFRINTNIRTVNDDRNFHLIQQYMLNMVAGNTTSMPPLPKGYAQSFVQDKAELLKLMGLNYGFWDVASSFYEELVMSGHIVETNLGLFAGDQVPANAKVLRTPSARCIPAPLVVDPFDCRICHKALLPLRPKDADNAASSSQKKICLLPYPAYLLDPNILERQVNEVNFNFDAAAEHSLTQQLMDQGLPGNTRGITLNSQEDVEPIEVLYLTCYLTLEQAPEGIRFQLYHVNNGAAVTQLPIEDPEHAFFRKTVLGLAECGQDHALYTKLSNTVDLRLREKGGALVPGVTLDEKGNYRCVPDLDTLQQLLTVDEPAARESLELILEGYPLVITDFEAGKLIYTELTDEHRQFCLDVLSGMDIQQALEGLMPKEETEEEEILPGQ